MSLINSTPFFTVKWAPAISPGLLPADPRLENEKFMTVGWQAKLGAVFYPFQHKVPVNLAKPLADS